MGEDEEWLKNEGDRWLFVIDIKKLLSMLPIANSIHISNSGARLCKLMSELSYVHLSNKTDQIAYASQVTTTTAALKPR